MDAPCAHSIYRPLDWRYRRAQHLVSSGLAPTDRDDSLVADMARYLSTARLPAAGARLQDKWPTHHAAHQLQRADGPMRWEVEARIVAGECDADIAATCSQAEGTIALFEGLFFAVRDRLRARDWLAGQVVWPSLSRGCGGADLSGLWRYFAFIGGARILDIVVAVTMGRALPPWATGTRNTRLADTRIRLAVRLAIQALRASPRQLTSLVQIRNSMIQTTSPQSGGSENPGLLEAMADIHQLSQSQLRASVSRGGKRTATKAPPRPRSEESIRQLLRSMAYGWTSINMQ